MRLVSPQQQLDLFHTMPGDIAARDAQDLMSWPFFSLAKSRRSAPIDFAMGATWISVEAVAEHGMATIWDADILIWAASQLVEARDAGRPTSRHIAARPHEILTFIGRGTGKDHYERLRAALDRLQSTTVATSIRQQHQRRRHRFSWINEWRETLDDRGRAVGIELILPDWFYAGVLDRGLILTIDRAYFKLTGGVERWLYTQGADRHTRSGTAPMGRLKADHEQHRSALSWSPVDHRSVRHRSAAFPSALLLSAC